MKRMIVGLAAMALLLGGIEKASADFIYNLVDYPGLQNGYTLSGTIVTNINSGTLAPANIVSFHYVATNGTVTSIGSSGDPGSTLSINGTVDISPTAITLGLLNLGIGNYNEFDVYGFDSLTRLIYARNAGVGDPNNGDYYHAEDITSGGLWFSSSAPAGTLALGDANNWIIATAAPSAVPVPSALVMASIMFGMIGVVWSYKRLKQRAVAG